MWTATLRQNGHSRGFGGRMRNSKYMKKSTVDSVIESRTPDTSHICCPRSVNEKSWLNQIGAELPNISRSGRKIQFRWLKNRFENRRMRSVSGISGCLKMRASTYGTSVTPHAQRLIWSYCDWWVEA